MKLLMGVLRGLRGLGRLGRMGGLRRLREVRQVGVRAAPAEMWECEPHGQRCETGKAG